MPTNALFLAGTGGSAATVCPLKDPVPERLHRRRHGRNPIPQLERANSFFCPSGRWPARGWVLVRRGDFNGFANKYATNFQLNFTDVETGTSITLQNLAIAQARCVSRGVAADPNALYLVELTDHQGVIESPWYCQPTTSQYNVRAPAYDGLYYSASLNSGIAWTWSGMIGDLWAQLPLLGPYPGLPTPPVGTPENWIFPGVSAWQAINRILDQVGMTVSVNLTQANPYGIVVIGAADAAFAGLQAKYQLASLEDDYEYIDAGAGRVPGQLIVYFHRRNQYFGTEETVRRDSLQWQSTPLYSVTVAAPAAFAGAPGTGYLWSDFTVRYDVDNNPLAADVTAAATIAAGQALDWYNNAYRGTLGYLKQVFTGALQFAAGSQVDGVRWLQTDRGDGWKTELIRGPQPPWKEVAFELYQ